MDPASISGCVFTLRADERGAARAIAVHADERSVAEQQHSNGAFAPARQGKIEQETMKPGKLLILAL
jgi:hypothetical protein